MAKLTWKSPIESVSGALYKGEDGKKSFGAAKRKTANKDGEKINHSVFYGRRSTTPDSAEIARRSKFATRAAAVQSRKASPTQASADKTAFANQSTYKSLNAYIWAQVIAAETNG